MHVVQHLVSVARGDRSADPGGMLHLSHLGRRGQTATLGRDLPPRSYLSRAGSRCGRGAHLKPGVVAKRWGAAAGLVCERASVRVEMSVLCE